MYASGVHLVLAQNMWLHLVMAQNMWSHLVMAQNMWLHQEVNLGTVTTESIIIMANKPGDVAGNRFLDGRRIHLRKISSPHKKINLSKYSKHPI